MNVICVTLIFLFLTTVQSAKILGIFQFPSRSHHSLGETLLKALAARGHEVTMLSPFRSKQRPENYNELVIPEIYDYKEENMAEVIMNMQNYSLFGHFAAMMHHMTAIDAIFYEHEIVTNLINSNKKFDIAIVCWFGNEAILGLSHRVANATIAYSTIGTSFMTQKLTKVPSPSSYVPNMMPPFPDEMDFTQRLGNTLVSLFGRVFSLIYDYYQRSLIDKHIPNAPSSYDLQQHVSLVFLNTHYSIESPRPYVPNMIQIGGSHLEEAKELTGELKHIMDNANEGVIFFSLGSNVKSADIPQETIRAILKSFANLPYTILWKFEKNISNLPRNVKISSWFPQKDILAHKNLKLFITHGGLLSTIEALHFGVPMIGIPIFADQSSNVLDGSVKGYLLHLPLSDLTEQTLENSILEVMHNPKYRKNVEKRSRIFKDQLVKPIEKATYWVEYVLRHEGAHHLKTSAFKLAWYEHYLLDVMAVILMVVAVSLFIIYKLIRYALCRKTKKSGRKRKPKTS